MPFDALLCAPPLLSLCRSFQSCKSRQTTGALRHTDAEESLSSAAVQTPTASAEKAPEAEKPAGALDPKEWRAFKLKSIDTTGPPNTSTYRCYTVT